MRSRLSPLLAAIPAPVLVAAPAVGVWMLWAAHGGGRRPSLWGSLGAVVVALLAMGLITLRVSLGREHQRLRLVMLAALGLFVAWSFLSIVWADFRGDAYAGAATTLAYAAGFALLALPSWTERALAIAVGLLGLGVAVVAVATLVRLAFLPDPEALIDGDGRLNTPAGYVNGSAALWSMGLWPAVYLGSSRAVPIALRALSLGVAPLLVALAFATQSRAWLAAVVLSAGLFVLLARRRLQTMVGLVLAAGPLVWLYNPLLDLVSTGEAQDPIGGAADRAVVWIVASCVGVAALGGLWAWADVHIQPSARLLKLGSVMTVVLALAVPGVGVAIVLAEVDHPIGWVEARWEEFTEQDYPSLGERSRIEGGIGSHRYEEWTIAWREFVSHPVTGIGVDNYYAPYVLHRADSQQDAAFPHSLPLKLLSQLGVVGTGLFVLSAGIAVLLGLRRRRALSPEGGGAIAVLLTVFAYWVIHGSVDWLWEIPALAGPAFGALGLACAPSPGGVRAASLARGRAAAVIAVATLAGAALALPAVSYGYQSAGVAVWREDPRTAYDRLELAADLNPLEAQPLILEGSIAIQLGDVERARSALGRAVEREPKNWYAYAQLGFLAGSLGEQVEARTRLEEALRLNPLEPVANLALDLVAAGKRLDPDALNRLYLDPDVVGPAATGYALTAGDAAETVETAVDAS